MQYSENVAAGKVVLTLTGKMEFNTRKTFQAAIENAKRSNPYKVILDFSHVPFINSAGLGLLMLAHKSLEEAKIRLSLEVTEGYVNDVFRLSSIGSTIPISVKEPQSAPPAPGKVPLSLKVIKNPSRVFESIEMEELLLPILKRLEDKDFNLPALPQIANQVLMLTNDPDTHAGKLTSLVQQDPVLTAKIFKTANSAACGTSREIESLSQAIAWLGLNPVAGLAFALSMQSGVFNSRGYEREVRALWAQTIATAFYAKALAGMIGKDQDTAFLCGLLHSIGKPFVVHTVNQYTSPSASPLPWSAMLTLMEQSYVEVGRQMADEWNFPPAVKEAINLHQHHAYHLATDPSKGAALTCLARHLASHHLDSVSISEETIRALPVAARLQIPHDVMDGILEIKGFIQKQIDSLLI